jgi:hypothetical protein
MMIQLTNRTHPMLRTFIELGSGYMNIEDAQAYDQRPFRAMLVRRWIAYRPGRGFHITREGREAYRNFVSTEIWRKDPTRPLTRYFDATAYALEPRKVHAMKMRGAA